MDRVLEESLMVNKDQVEAWNSAHRQFTIDGFVEWFKHRKDKQGLIVDIGCGTGTLAFSLLDEFPNLKIKGFDGSPAMIDYAERTIKEKSLEDSYSVECKMIEDIEPIPECKTIISLGVLHHFADPIVFWKSLDRISPPGSVWMILDIHRAKDENEINEIIEVVSGTNKNNQLYIDDLANSLRAAFTEQEIRDQLSSLGLRFNIDLHINPVAGEIMMIQVKK